jgi:hypothetical protein
MDLERRSQDEEPRMQRPGPRVSLRAVIGGMCVPGFVHFMWDAHHDGQTRWLVLGYAALVTVCAAGLIWMLIRTRHNRSQRGWQRWLLDTMKLAGTVVAAGILIFIVTRSVSILAGQ